jgi:hypothetical protein
MRRETFRDRALADLIITNGDSAADLLAAAGKAGTILPWRDILHEGPIVEGSLAACSAVRVPFLAGRFRIPEAEIAAEFAERDGLIADHTAFDRIELWFEHDLYDQLQLVQAVDALGALGRVDGVILVQADDFLGRQSAETILAFAAGARPLAAGDYALAARAWSALAAPSPEAVFALAGEPLPGFPHLAAALRRFLEELPSPGSGLGRTETAALEGVAHGITDPVELFRSAIGEEEAAFMGDLSFFRLLEDLAFAGLPLIEGLGRPPEDGDWPDFASASLRLTPAGEDILEGEDDRCDLAPVERWWGGTWLAAGRTWRYDRRSKMLVRPGGSGA